MRALFIWRFHGCLPSSFHLGKTLFGWGLWCCLSSFSWLGRALFRWGFQLCSLLAVCFFLWIYFFFWGSTLVYLFRPLHWRKSLQVLTYFLLESFKMQSPASTLYGHQLLFSEELSSSVSFSCGCSSSAPSLRVLGGGSSSKEPSLPWLS